jgi:hypothetical protein
MTLIGSGITDYLDPVLDGRHLAAIVDLLAEHLFQQSEWDVCNQQDLREHTPLAALGAATEDMLCSRLAMPRRLVTFLESRPHHLKRNLRQSGKKVEVNAASGEPAARPVDRTARRTRWRESGEPGMIATKRIGRFSTRRRRGPRKQRHAASFHVANRRPGGYG